MLVTANTRFFQTLLIFACCWLRRMASSSPPPSSLDDTTKAAAVGTVDEKNKLQGYGSAPDIVDEVTRVVDHKAERRLCRRFDFRLLPVLAIMCELSSSAT